MIAPQVLLQTTVGSEADAGRLAEVTEDLKAMIRNLGGDPREEQAA